MAASCHARSVLLSVSFLYTAAGRTLNCNCYCPCLCKVKLVQNVDTSTKTASWSASLHFRGCDDHTLPVTATKSGSRFTSSLRSAQGDAVLEQERCTQQEGIQNIPDSCFISRADWTCRACVSDRAEANQQPQPTAQEAMPVQVPKDMSLVM